MSAFDPRALTFPPPEPYPLETYHPQPLLPFQPPPQPAALPAHPSGPRSSLLDEWYTLSRHILPATRPRVCPRVPVPPALPRWSPDKNGEYKQAMMSAAQDILTTKQRHRAGALDDLPHDERQLWNTVDRYVRRGLCGAAGDGAGVTLFLAHATGLPKETWEPTLERLVRAPSAGYVVDEIWLWEATSHGDAAILNASSLGGIADWRDNSRDMLNFLLYYLPAAACSDVLPAHLVPVSESEAGDRDAHGLRGRRLVTIGHSFGGCSVVRAAIEHPLLFPYNYLIEAMIYPKTNEGDVINSPNISFSAGALSRRDVWSSREEAHRLFAATPFFGIWDPAVLRLYVEHGLYEPSSHSPTVKGKTEDDPPAHERVRLKTTSLQEAVCFADGYTTWETFELLVTMDDRVRTRWVIAGKISDDVAKIRQKVVWRRGNNPNSTHVRILSAGHLIPMEAPADLASDLHEFLARHFGSPKASL